MMDAAVTYMPRARLFVAGEHMSMPDWNPFETFSSKADPIGDISCDVRCRDHDCQKLIQTYCTLRRMQQKWSPLDFMFTRLDLDGIVCNEEFRTNVIEPQTVPRLGQYKPNDKYGRVGFSLNIANSYDMPSDLTKDETSVNAIRALRREQQAFSALKQIPYYYKKDTIGNEAKFRNTTPPADNGAQRICVQDDGHSNAKMVEEIGRFVSQFESGLKLPPTHAACSPNTAMRIARNVGIIDPHFEEACQTHGGEFDFPGFSSQSSCVLKMVVSSACPDNVLYVTSKISRILLKAEGPKITKQNRSGTHTVRDFCQYKCAYEDLSTDSPFACIVCLKTT